MIYKLTLSTLFFFASYMTTAQMTVTDLQGNPIQDGSTITSSTVDLEDAKFHYILGNNSSDSSINILIEVVSFNNTDGSDCQLCVQPLCFFAVNEGQSYPNNPVALAPNSDNGLNDYFSNTNSGDGVNYPLEYVLRFYQVDDNGQEVGNDITVTYEYTPENFSNEDFDLENMGISIENTLVNDYLKLNSQTNAQFKVYDVNSKLIDSYRFNQGQHSFDMSKLNAGNYFLVFFDQKGRKSYARIQKQ